MTLLGRVVEWLARVRAADALPDGLTKRGFLSYNRADRRQAKWLHRRLERYRMPWRLVGAHGANGAIPRRLSPVFRDRENAQAASSVDTLLRDELARSQHLIVLCTPASAGASYVNLEIEMFRRARPDGPIHAVIGAGDPPGCFPSALLITDADDVAHAPLAADLRAPSAGGDGTRRGFIKLVAGILGVSFDTLWQRERRRRVWRMVWGAAGATAIVTIVVAGSRQYRSARLEEARTACADTWPGSRARGLAAIRRAARAGTGPDLISAYLDCLQRPGFDEVGSLQGAELPVARQDEPVVTAEAAGVRATVQLSAVDGAIDLATTWNGRPLAVWRFNADSFDAAGVSPDGRFVALVYYPFAFSRQFLALFDSRAGEQPWPSALVEDQSLGHKRNRAPRVGFDRRGRYVSVAGMAGVVRAWDSKRCAFSTSVR